MPAVLDLNARAESSKGHGKLILLGEGSSSSISRSPGSAEAVVNGGDTVKSK